MEPRAPSRPQVVAWLEAVRQELERLQDRLAPLLEEQRRLEARQALLKDLLSSFEASPKASSEDATRSWALTVQPAGSIGEYVRERAQEILREAARPLHINELHAEFERRGFHVPGAGKPVNLIVHLRNHSGIVSPGRGMYALEEQTGPIPARRKSRTRRRKRTRRPQESSSESYDAAQEMKR
jgi:hypothetical protein